MLITFHYISQIKVEIKQISQNSTAHAHGAGFENGASIWSVSTPFLNVQKRILEKTN